jgi:hypothetical protein
MHRPSSLRAAAAILALLATLPAGCEGMAGDRARIDTVVPDAGYGVEPVELDGVRLYRPLGSSVVGGTTGEGGGIRILGPLISVGTPGETGSWTGAAYALEVNTHPNPDGFSAAEFAQEWLRSADALELDHGQAVIGGRIAYRVNTFGGDAEWVNLFVPHGDRVALFTYRAARPEQNPIAPLSRDAHALLLATVRFER